MGTLKLLFTLAIIAYSIYSFIVYLSRRSENKDALRSLRDEGEPVRSLTPEEGSALAPFLFQPTKPDKPMPLKRPGVFLLEGDFNRHGISTGNGGETFHDTIDRVEVILPYDARDFLEPYCKAEVVFTEKFAIVVTLNGTFDLAGGRARGQRRQLQERQWSSGQAGAVTDVEPDRLEALKDEGVEVTQIEQAMRVEILGQRDETPAEVLARSGPGVGLLAGTGFAIAFVGLGVASSLDGADRWWGVVPAALFGALALWGVWSRKGLPPAGKVNRVRGHVHAIAVALPGQTVAPTPRWFVGDKVPVELPDHWKVFWQAPPPEAIEADLRVADHTAVRFGKALSIDDEVRRATPVHWGRHLTLALVGAIALGALAMTADSLRSDVVLTLAKLQQKDPLTADSAEALLSKLPDVGTPVLLTGKARCDWGGADLTQFDCSRMYWGGAAPRLGDVEIDAVTASFKSTDFLNARSDPRLEIMMQLEMARRGMGSPLDAYRAGNPYAYGMRPAAPKIVTGVADVVKMVDTNCPGSSIECTQLKKALSESLKIDDEEAPRTWAAWSRLAADGKLTGDNANALILADGLSQVQSASKGVAEARVRTLVAATAQQWREQGKGGVVLTTWPGAGTTLPETTRADDAFAALTTAREMADEAGPRPFTVQGLVVERLSPEGGVVELHVDGQRTLADPWPSVLRVVFLLLALGLLAVHSVALVVTARKANQRARDLAELNQARIAKSAFIV